VVGIPQPSIPQMASVWGSWGNAVRFVILGELSPEQAFSDAGTQIRTLIAGGTIAPAITGKGDTPPEDGPQAVSIPGTIQTKLGCSSDWTPDCEEAQLAYSANSDVWLGSFQIEAGDYEYKVAINGTWDENYGAMGVPGGDNIALSLADDATVLFVYDHKTHWIADSVNAVIASVPGSFQDEIGCSSDWAPDCLRSWLQDTDGDGVYTFTTTAIPAGDYEAKVAVNLSWDENYGVDGAPGGDNLKFTVPADGAEVTFSFDSATKVLTITVA
jgi:hypothetical protein